MAIALSYFDQESMEFVEERRLARQVSVQKLLRQAVAGGGGEKRMPHQDAARVGIGDEERPLGGVEQDGIRCFRTDSGQGEELAAEFFLRLAEELG